MPIAARPVGARVALPLLVALAVPALARAQAPAPVTPPAHAALAPAAAIAAAVAPLPKDMRAGATVLGWAGKGTVVLRQGSNDMICLAPDPARAQFHTACYHTAMEPFMKRGRELRAQGVTGDQVDSVRFREAREKKLALPTQPASLYTLTGGTVDPASGAVSGASANFVVYIPYATAQSTGLSTVPTRDGPWLMFPGTPKAHIMFSHSM
jgi:hypothetical protein